MVVFFFFTFVPHKIGVAIYLFQKGIYNFIIKINLKSGSSAYARNAKDEHVPVVPSLKIEFLKHNIDKRMKSVICL